MRKAVLLFLVLAATAFLAACGHGSSSSSSSTAPASVAVAPSTLSLNQTDVASITATVVDSTGTAITNPKPIAFSSSDTSVATVNPGTGAVCAGQWDSNFINCTAGKVGSATITAASMGVTGAVTVYVHAKVDSVVITTPMGACKSVGQTLQLTAVAYNKGTDVTSSVGPLNWFVNTTAVATVDNTGLLTAQAPGSSKLYASISNVISAPVTYTTCAVRSINLHVSGGSNTAFTVASAATQQLAADVVDTAGNTISPTLTWVSVNPTVVNVSTTGLVTAVDPGTTGVIAECALNCNYNLPPVYSNTVQPSVSGTSATTVYVTGTGTTQLIPIDTGTNAAGTTITLPAQPNSFVFAPNATQAYLGSSGGLITLDTTSNAVSQNTAIPGKVLAVSPDSNYVVVADSGSVYVQSATAGGSAITLGISGATAAAFTPDGTQLFIVAGSTLYAFNDNTGEFSNFSLTAPANDIAVLPSAAFFFMAGGAPHALTARATCDVSGAANYTTPGNPTLLAVTADAKIVLATDSPKIDVVTRSSLAQPGCPPLLQGSVSSVDLGQGAFTANDFVLSTNGAQAYVASNLPNIIAYNVSAGTASAIPLANGATGLSESLTLDGAQLYVGGSDKNVHRIDTAGAKDAQEISVGFTPDLVAVRPK